MDFQNLMTTNETCQPRPRRLIVIRDENEPDISLTAAKVWPRKKEALLYYCIMSKTQPLKFKLQLKSSLKLNSKKCECKSNQLN